MSSRPQPAPDIDNLDQASRYYSQLFDTHPHKTRKAYANFTIAKPPLVKHQEQSSTADKPTASRRSRRPGNSAFQ